MAEPKRIQLGAPKTLHREKEIDALPPTYRFELTLTDTIPKNSDYAEYSYAMLVEDARSAESDSKHPGSDDPFSLDDDDRKLQEIARRYEEKYNPKPGRKKKKKLVISEDYIDKGMGYDENDSFIDNEEAYDELVPSTLTTQFGGFYINKGDLEFRNLGDDGDTKIRKKRFKGFDKERKKRRRLGTEDNQKHRGRKSLNHSTSALIKPVKKSQPTVADMLQQQKAKLQLMQQEGIQQMTLNPISVEREIEPEVVEENDVVEVPNPGVTQPSQASTISEAIESVVKAATEDAASNESAGAGTGSSDGEELAKPPVENIEAPKLPDNLPSELGDVVTKLKEVAFKSEEGKCKFFSDDVNQMLLSIELKAQELTSAQRSTIYSHLASHLPCTKETLQKRAKKLRLDQEDGKLKEPMQRLKDSIAAVMPEMLEKYAARLKACDTKDEERKNENAVGGSEGEDSQEEGEKKLSRLPKKHFEWNDTIRKYLCDVVRIKLKCYEVSKTRIQSAEGYLKHFLEAEVKNLWPPGWMESRILFRESRAAHFCITSRPKKQILVPKKNNNPLASVATKPAVSILNNSVTQESEFDKIFPDKSVPLIPPVENVLERRENLDLLASNNVVSAEERAAEFARLFTHPIQSSVPDDLSVTKNQDSTITQTIAQTDSIKTTVEPFNTSSPITNSKTDIVVLSKPTTKSDKHSRLIQQNKQSPFPPKVADYATFKEGSLASDMLARIICASLADYPYSGSHNVESAPKTSSVISPNPGLMKEAYTLNSNVSNDLYTSPKKLEAGKSSTDKKKTSQDLASHHLSGVGLNIESLLKNQNISRQSDSGLAVKNKGLPTESSTAVNLKLKDAIVPHSRQFAEAFERTDIPVFNKKHKGLNIESLLKNQIVSRQSDSGLAVKNKGLPAESSTAVNLKLKDTIVPHSRQFAEAFERTDIPVNKKHKGLNIESLLKNQNVSRQSDSGLAVKNKGLPTENSTAINLKMKETIVPHSWQFAEAFERTDIPVNKKHKGHNVQPQNYPISTSSSSRLLNATEQLSEYSSSTSQRGSLENAYKIALESANKYANTTQVYATTTQVTAATTPYKKRTKFASSSKVNDPWTQLFDASVGSSLLEGMKGFPFPVSIPTSLPTPPPAHSSPPPAHSSSPHRTTAHIQHNSPRTTSHISPGLRSIHEPKSETISHISPGLRSIHEPKSETISHISPGLRSIHEPKSETTSHISPGLRSIHEPKSETTSHISPGLRSIHEPKSETSNQNPQSRPNIITVTNIQREGNI